MTVDPLLSFS